MWTIKENTLGLEEDLSKFLKKNIKPGQESISCFYDYNSKNHIIYLDDAYLKKNDFIMSFQ